MAFTIYRQLNAMDCGPTCLRMIARYHGKNYTTRSIRHTAGFGKEGVSLLGISDAAEKIGFRTRGVQLNYDQLITEVSLPCILHWNNDHFVVLIRTRRGVWNRKVHLGVADPAKGLISYSKNEFVPHWISAVDENGDLTMGNALLLEPGPGFYQQEGEQDR
jgi:ATP-binding cassette subfamily B protein